MKLSLSTMVYKNVEHKMNCCEISLCNDIETNPGPSESVDSSKTIIAPYSQGNATIFGTNAGQQCAAMSLSALIYNCAHPITSPIDLMKIMDIGNELYSSLSKLYRQSFLMLSELPMNIMMLNNNYQLEYSDSYSGNVQGTACIESFSYCTSLYSAFQSLRGGRYSSFILTIGNSTVSIYCTEDNIYKVFDSHARDLFGMPHAQGTCVLLEMKSITDLVEYFKTLYSASNVLFEMKGVHITNGVSCSQNEITIKCHSEISETVHTSKSAGVLSTFDDSNLFDFKRCCAIAFYCICFSLINPCGYWNSATLYSIVEHANNFYERTCTNISSDTFTRHNLPNKLEIYEADINVVTSSKNQGIMCPTSITSMHNLHSLILDRIDGNTGFLLLIPNCCVSCIFQRNSKGKVMKYFIVAVGEGQIPEVFKDIKSIDTIFQTLGDILTKNMHCFEMEYCIHFLSCSCPLSYSERQKIMRKHKCIERKKLISETKKDNYMEMEPGKKKLCQENLSRYYKNVSNVQKKDKYRSIDPLILIKSAEKYQIMDSLKKQDLLTKSAEQYQSMDPLKKQELLTKSAEQYESMDSLKKQELLTKSAEQYQLMDPLKRQELLTKKGKNKKQKYNNMDTIAKQKYLYRVKENYNNMDCDKKIKQLAEKQDNAKRKRETKNCS